MFPEREADVLVDTGKEITVAMTPTPTRKPLLCRLNIRHAWRVERAPEGGTYRRCSKCGKDDPGDFTEGQRGDNGLSSML
jgi:hypothetical protein